MTEVQLPPARLLLKERDYVVFWLSRFLGSIGSTVQSVVMAWVVYSLSREQGLDIRMSAFNVSLIGLITFAPLFFLALPAGETVDRYQRKRVLMACYIAEALVVGVLAASEIWHFISVPLLLTAAFFFGVSRSFFQPAGTALGPMLVPRELLPRAIAWNSLAWQTASIGGPMLAGVLVAMSPAVAFCTTLALYLAAALALSTIQRSTQPTVQPGSRFELVKEGLAYVWSNKIVFGAISLDLAAVILGGATALLPAFARDILHVGEGGFGILRAGNGIGATLVALWLAANPIHRRAGTFMFSGVGVFGLATVVFGLSAWIATGLHLPAELSHLGATPITSALIIAVIGLAILGGADMLSVYVRQTLVQLVTPDPMRGRVAAVSTLFISASNELGEFESGIVARFLGPVGAAVFGGVGALIVTGLWARMFPALRKADRLE